MSAAPHRVAVIGGGFGGLEAAKHCAAPVEVTLVDRRNFHLFQPLTYQVATGALSPAEVSYPLRAIFKRPPNVRVVLADGRRSSTSTRASCGCGRAPSRRPGVELAYDTLVVAGGSRYSYFGHEEWQEYAARGEVARERDRASARGSSAPSRRPRSRPTPSERRAG